MHDGLNEMSDRPHHNIKPRGHHNNIRRQCLTKGVSTVGSNVTRRPSVNKIVNSPSDSDVFKLKCVRTNRNRPPRLFLRVLLMLASS